jgi:hypothetical protein
MAKKRIPCTRDRHLSMSTLALGILFSLSCERNRMVDQFGCSVWLAYMWKNCLSIVLLKLLGPPKSPMSQSVEPGLLALWSTESSFVNET